MFYIQGHQKTVESIAVSPSGDFVYSSDRGGNIARFNRATGALDMFTGKGHGDKPIVRIALSADGKKLVGEYRAILKLLNYILEFSSTKYH